MSDGKEPEGTERGGGLNIPQKKRSVQVSSVGGAGVHSAATRPSVPAPGLPAIVQAPGEPTTEQANTGEIMGGAIGEALAGIKRNITGFTPPNPDLEAPLPKAVGNENSVPNLPREARVVVTPEGEKPANGDGATVIAPSNAPSRNSNSSPRTSPPPIPKPGKDAKMDEKEKDRQMRKSAAIAPIDTPPEASKASVAPNVVVKAGAADAIPAPPVASAATTPPPAPAEEPRWDKEPRVTPPPAQAPKAFKPWWTNSRDLLTGLFGKVKVALSGKHTKPALAETMPSAARTDRTTNILLFAVGLLVLLCAALGIKLATVENPVAGPPQPAPAPVAVATPPAWQPISKDFIAKNFGGADWNAFKLSSASGATPEMKCTDRCAEAYDVDKDTWDLSKGTWVYLAQP